MNNSTGNKGQLRIAKPGYSIDIVDLRKSFQRQTLSKGNYGTIKSSLLGLFRQRSSARELTHAIHDLTMRIPKGASVGIIGQNGSGKSTLLKLMTGIYKPTSGTVNTIGRVAALIELGAGFHPDFTGRENLFLGGVMHGLSKAEIRERFDEIVDFAELKAVIDDPVRTYSSGMFMRLGFSLAVHTDPDVLLIDEVLAVGDASFVAKCKDKIAALRKAGKTLLLVTHDLGAVESWCDEALWLHKGKVKDRGNPRRVIDAYRQFLEKKEEREMLRLREEESTEREEDTKQGQAVRQDTEKARWGSREIEITALKVVGGDREQHLVFHPEDSLELEIHYQVHEPIPEAVFGIGINRTDGLVVHGSNTDIERIDVPALGQSGVVRYSISRLGLLEARYTIDVAVHREDGYPYDYHKCAVEFAVRQPIAQLGVYSPDHQWIFEPSLSEKQIVSGGKHD